MSAQLQEIREYLQHQENSLANRRLLDAAYDSGDLPLLQKAIQCSQLLFEAKQDAFAASASTLIDELHASSNVAAVPQVLIEAKGVSKSYNTGHFSLKPVSMTLQSGEIIGVVGENGNGKTTYLRALSGQLAIDEGEVSYGQLKKQDYYAVKSYIAFVPQRIPRWFGYLKDNLHFSASISGYTGKTNDVMVDYVIHRFGLQPYAHLTWNQISSGYRTRFEIARILLQKPSLLVLDEPLANLDINAQQTLLTDLKLVTKSKRHNMGIILSSQQLHEVEKVADDVMMLKQGELVYTRKTQEAQQKESLAATTVIEIETKHSRSEIEKALGNVKISFTGGYYMIETSAHTLPQLILALVSNGIELTYLRDISTSTKQYFNKL
jgi:ABC-2 type transport system ATP-binding protein